MNKTTHLGYSKNPGEAAAIYNHAAKILHGSHAQLNPTTATLTDEQKAKIEAKLSASQGTTNP